MSEGRYDYFKTEFIPKNSLDIAKRWYYLNRTSRLETMSMSWSRDTKLTLKTKNYKKRILECSEKLQDVKLTSRDFEYVIDKTTKEAFLLVSPPYSIHHSSHQNKLHKHPFERKDHLRLADALKRNSEKINFMLTYNDNDEIRKMYSWSNDIIILDLANTSPRKNELIIMNY